MNFDVETIRHLTSMLEAYGLNVIGAIIILLVGWSLARWAEGITRSTLTRTSKVDPTLTGFLASVSRYLVLVFTVIAVLNRFGVQTASLIAVLGAAGLAVGLAMQGTLSSAAAGVMLLVFRPFKLGDYVEVSGQSGTVHSLNLFVTELTTPDNRQIIIPNSNVWGQSVVNYSHHATRRLDLEIGIGYGDDIDLAVSVIREILDADERVLKSPEPVVVVGSLGASSVDLTVRVWVNAGDYWPLKFDLNKRFKQGFDARGISIPFTQMEVHLHQQG